MSASLVLDPGTEAPDFTLKDQNGQPVSLSDFRGAKNVLLVFFPLAFTGICQGELDEIRDNLPKYENDDTATLAISVGPPPTHKVWATQSGFTFPVLGRLLAARRGRAGLRGVQRRRGLRQPWHVRRRSLGHHPVRRDETARRGARSGGLDRRADGAEVGLRISGRTLLACSFPSGRARSSVVELWFYTPAVGGSIPSAPTIFSAIAMCTSKPSDVALA